MNALTLGALRLVDEMDNYLTGIGTPGPRSFEWENRWIERSRVLREGTGFAHSHWPGVAEKIRAARKILLENEIDPDSTIPAIVSPFTARLIKDECRRAGVIPPPMVVYRL